MKPEDFEKTSAFKPSPTSFVGKKMLISVFDGEKPPFQIDLHAFKRSTVTFGRNPDNDIVLESPLVSRYHGKFIVANGSCTIIDNNSTNGLILNGKPINCSELSDDDTIRIDDAQNRLQVGVMFIFGTLADATWDSFEIGSRTEITIGRDISCDIRLDHVSVSKNHAKISKENGTFYIIDTNSTNGVSVNGKRVERKQALKEKDVILITNSKLTFTSRSISYCCFNTGISLDAVNIVKTVKTKSGPVDILDQVTLSINPCEFVAIIGGSGAGKTTFMNCISGYSPATSGTVLANGESLYANYDVVKSIIGYVPQKDIVYDNLVLRDMLDYAARLRMPKDTDAMERARRVQDVIDSVELTGKEDVYIRQLSGGQKKRASIAVELLSDPTLFFLDEPSSGLDPGTERNLMLMLRRVAKQGKTIITVTHNVQNLHLCDKVVIMGKGGKLCFCGSPAAALEFFQVDNFVDIYNLITENASSWHEAYLASDNRFRPKTGQAGNNTKINADYLRTSQSWLRQFIVLCKRYIKLIFNDRQTFIIQMLEAPVLALLIALVANGQQFEEYETTKMILFALACCAFWIGIMSAIQEVCKERVILRREYMTGLKISSYIASKFSVLALLCLIQSFLLSGDFVLTVGCPERGLILPAFLEIYITTFLTAYSAAALGLFVSTLFKSSDGPMAIAPLLLVPQILFSGLVFELTGLTRRISVVFACRWAAEGFGTTANLNDLPYKAEALGLEAVHTAEDYFTYTNEHLLSAWGILLLMVAIYIIVSIIALQRIKKDNT